MTCPVAISGSHRLTAIDFLRDTDLRADELVALLDLADDVKRSPSHYSSTLGGQSVVLMFEKPSLRTRCTFEIGIHQLGGNAVQYDGPVGGREPLKDVARNFERWVGGIVARTFKQSTLDELAKWASVPVVNALSDLYHPCQALADTQTLREHFGELRGLKVTFVGDGNNVSHSLMLCMSRLGVDFWMASPSGYLPNPEILAAAQEAAAASGGSITLTHDPVTGVKGANAVYTDTWVSMGWEAETSTRHTAFREYQVNSALMRHADPASVFMHCLPATRGEEVTDEVIESKHSIVFDQAENRLHAQKALMVALLWPVTQTFVCEKTMKLWGGRFETGPSEIFERFSGSLHFDKRLLEVDIRGSQAFARALERAAILTADERGRIVAAFDEILKESRAAEFFDGATDEDVHTLVIRKLKEKAGGVADKIHTGRSRNEQVSLDTRLWVRSYSEYVRMVLSVLLRDLLDLAEKYPDAVIPGYTHMRRAQAVLWPHYLLAYFEMFLRDYHRFGYARRAANQMPLGSGALAGSGFKLDRRAIAQDLDFEDITANSMDVSADRDFVLDFLYAASVTMLHLSRLAEDWILYSSEEFGWMELGDGVTSGSSLMPQKKNPDSLELIRGKCGRVIGALNSLMITMKGLPTTYNRDMQEDKEPLFQAADQLIGCLEMAHEVAVSLVLHPAVPLEHARESWVVATDLAEALARSGIPFHQAHTLVGRLVLESVKESKQPEDWDAETLRKFAPEFTPPIAEMLAKLLDPREGMKSREIPGGTGPEHVRTTLQARRALLNSLQHASGDASLK